MFRISVNATEGKLSAGVMNEETKCAGRMNAAKIYAVSRNEENMNAANMSAGRMNAVNVNASNTNAVNTNAANVNAETRENAIAVNFTNSNVNAMNTNAGSTKETVTRTNASNMSGGKKNAAMRKP